MNILFISTKYPFPTIDGHSLRTFNILKSTSRSFNIFFLTFLQKKQESEDDKIMEDICYRIYKFSIDSEKSNLEKLKTLIKSYIYNRPFIVEKYKTRKMEQKINEIIKQNNIDIVHLDLLPLAEYIKIVKNIPIVLVEHNVESDLLLKRIRYEKLIFKWFYFIEYLKLKKFEKWAIKNVDVTISVSENDKMRLNNLSKCSKIEIVENGVDIERYKNNNTEEDKYTILFVGGLNWFPNLDAVKYFTKKIWPNIIRQIPNAIFKIVGMYSKHQIIFSDKSIKLLGFVNNEIEIIESATILVVPLRVGGGTRLKILNALSMEKAVVSTSIGAEGIDVRNGLNIILADNNLKFAEEVVNLIKCQDLRKKLGKEGRKLVESKYSWELIGKKMNGLYNEIIDKEGKNYDA